MSLDGQLPANCTEQDINEAGGCGYVPCVVCGTGEYALDHEQCPECDAAICDYDRMDELNCPNCGAELKPEKEE